ncbi:MULTISPECIES: regulatory protein RecX [Arthrobacter]|uniref:Regulatory protein RecX n=2 Tax=Arthrobacter TaxID=1663 RepID=A0ABU9KM73_9MICC|nr:regulatory protein RecX [Arthrobacter sp. YJM1]MDP5227857.1 regulatory protein RecX [Arthrobacter sp. YJM1]
MREDAVTAEPPPSLETMFDGPPPLDLEPPPEEEAFGEPPFPEDERDSDADADPESVARAIVLRQLSAGPRTRHQLAVKLKDREVPEAAARVVLDRFEELTLIDDREFAALWVRSRSEHRHLGSGALRRELRDKGVAEPLIAEALEQLSQDAERESAQHLVARKLARVDRGSLDRKERDKHTRRLVAMLVRKGHSPGTAFSVVAEELDREPEEWDADE